eukprot:863310_1
MPINKRTESLRPDYENKDWENHIYEIQIAVWTFLFFIDGFHAAYVYKYYKRGINQSDKLLFIHHLLGIIGCSILRYHNNGGEYMAWMGFWTE